MFHRFSSSNTILLKCIYFVLAIIILAKPISTEVRKCKHNDPYDRIDIWAAVSSNSSNCDPTSDPNEMTDEREKERYEWGEKKFAYNLIVSDKIGSRRYLPPMYHKLCTNISYDHLAMDASIVIVYNNEGLSVLIRMLTSIFDRTPDKLLKEVILFDDSSDEDTIIIEKILQYANIDRWPWQKLVVKRSEEHLGLIRARVEAARLATADIVIFLDSHCEVTERWIEPLIAAIEEDPKRLVVPVVDLISPKEFSYMKAMVAKGVIDWGLSFSWKYFPWEYFDIPENNVKPYKNPIISGGLFAIKRTFFKEMGEYDATMETWGCENVEISLRIWLCDGSIVATPCSRVGHVFKARAPSRKSNLRDSSLFNCLRTVKVWLDDYEKYFYMKRPSARAMDPGDLKERLELKKSLNCKPFEWFLKEIYPDLVRQMGHEEL